MISILVRWRGYFQAVNEAKVLVSKTIWSTCSNLFTPKIDPVLPLGGYLRTHSSFLQDFAFHSYLSRSEDLVLELNSELFQSFESISLSAAKGLLSLSQLCLMTVGEPREWCATQELLQHIAFLPMCKPQFLPQWSNTVELLNWVPIPC